MLVLKYIRSLLFDSPRWFFILLICVLAVMRTGIWAIPNFRSYMALAQDPFSNTLVHDTYAHYMFYNWLGLFVTWFFEIKTIGSFFVFHFIFSVLFIILFFYVVFSRFSDEDARKACLLFFACSVSMTSFFWVSYDCLLLFFMMLPLAFPRFLILVFLCGFAAGMEHFFQSVIAFSILFVVLAASRKELRSPDYSLVFCLVMIAGICLGRLVIQWVIYDYQIDVNSGRVVWVFGRLSLTHLIQKALFNHLHLAVWTTLGVGWFIVLRYIDEGKKVIPCIIGLLFAVSFVIVTLDSTRVGANLSLPLLSVFWFFSPYFLIRLRPVDLSLLFILWLVVPWIYIMGDLRLASSFSYDVQFILNYFFGWFENTGDWVSLPK